MRNSVVGLSAGSALLLLVGLSCSLDRVPRSNGEIVLGVSRELTLEDGARLTIPEGAFDGSVELAFEIVEPSTRPPLPDSFAALGNMYALMPHGTTFDDLVKLSVPAMGHTAEELVMLTLTDDEDDDWSPVSEPLTITGDAAILPLDHFSFYQLGLWKDAPSGPTKPDVVNGKCGDGIRDLTEACDDGVNDGSYGGCMPGCKKRAPHCGDGVVSADEGETCDGNCVSEKTCVSSNSCIMPMFAGAANTCDAVCDLMTVIQTCGLDDGCCPTDCTWQEDSDCSKTCGNGQLDPGETCEPDLGDCPVDCNDGMACTADMLTGSDCNQACANTPITMPAEGDGCCPPGANASTDSDCSPTCGDGFLDAGEVCDDGVNDGAYDGCLPGCVARASFCGDGVTDSGDGETCDGESCACVSPHACVVSTQAGDPAQCTATCQDSLILTCNDNDGCCPSGCNSTTDNDCSATCGNGVVEPGETCDTSPNSPVRCPTSCADQDVCTRDQLTGGGCNVSCVNIRITMAADNDGCCPSGFNFGADNDCPCGNGIVEGNEVCDDGVNNGGYGGCRANCLARGPYCGDGNVNGMYGEVCDDRVNDNRYNGCSMNCRSFGPRCGDRNVDSANGEVCDDGVNNNSYNGCAPDCRSRGPRCGDGTVNVGSAEVCDDGKNDNSYNSCSANCRAFGPRCGDGNIDAADGEVCDDGINDGSYGGCTAFCRQRAPYCGDGVINVGRGEVCDDGVNDGSYGGCARNCQSRGPYCGDGVVNGNEVCDNGMNNGSYGGCMAGCMARAAYCGDGVVNGNEVCDDGVNDGSYKGCMPGCQALAPYCGDGTIDRSDGEVCDDRVNDGSYNGCMPNCRTRGPYCGDGMVAANRELCDGNCPTQSSCVAAMCETAVLSGAAGTCDAVCTRAPITACANDDGCCPSGCTNANDNNCIGVCGDGIQDPGETCDDGQRNGQQGACNSTCSDTVRTFAQLHRTFINQSCATGNCHDSSSVGGLQLSTEASDANLIDQAANCDQTFVRVVGKSPDTSVFFLKVATDLQPPTNCVDTPTFDHKAVLNATQVRRIRDWINSL